MKTKLLAAFGLALAGVAGLSLSDEIKQQSSTHSPTPTAGQTPKPDKNVRYFVIGYLEKRDGFITIKSGPNGRVYSVSTRDSKLLHENLSLEQLKARAPEFHDLIKTGNAGDASLRVTAVNASFR
jgi:hypothetical protein